MEIETNGIVFKDRPNWTLEYLVLKNGKISDETTVKKVDSEMNELEESVFTFKVLDKSERQYSQKCLLMYYSSGVVIMIGKSDITCFNLSSKKKGMKVKVYEYDPVKVNTFQISFPYISLLYKGLFIDCFNYHN